MEGTAQNGSRHFTRNGCDDDDSDMMMMMIAMMMMMMMMITIGDEDQG